MCFTPLCLIISHQRTVVSVGCYTRIPSLWDPLFALALGLLHFQLPHRAYFVDLLPRHCYPIYIYLWMVSFVLLPTVLFFG